MTAHLQMEAAGTSGVTFLQWAFHPCETLALVCSYNTTWLKLLFQHSFYQKRNLLCVFWMLWFALQRGPEVKSTSIDLLQKLPLTWSSSLLQLELKEITSKTAPHQARQSEVFLTCLTIITETKTLKTLTKSTRRDKGKTKLQNKNVTWS